MSRSTPTWVRRSTPARVRRSTPTRVALVTGAGSGIGAALVRRLTSEGIAVLATDLRLDTVAHWPEHARVDVTDLADWEHALERAVQLGRGRPVRLQVFNSAGLSTAAPLLDPDPSILRTMLEVNLLGAVHAVTATARLIGDLEQGHQGRGHQGRGHQGRGHRAQVVNICSFAGVTAVPGLALYSAVKHAVRGFSLAAAQELHGQRVSVTVAAVDGVASPMLYAQVNQPEAAIAFSAPRLLLPDEVADELCRRLRWGSPPELLIPRSRGVVMKIGSLWPRIGALGGRRLAEVGRRQQQRYRADWPADDPDASPAGAPRTGPQLSLLRRTS